MYGQATQITVYTRKSQEAIILCMLKYYACSLKRIRHNEALHYSHQRIIKPFNAKSLITTGVLRINFPYNLHSPISSHGVVLKFIKAFTFPPENKGNTEIL
jgi:hypothetical protein